MGLFHYSTPLRYGAPGLSSIYTFLPRDLAELKLSGAVQSVSSGHIDSVQSLE